MNEDVQGIIACKACTPTKPFVYPVPRVDPMRSLSILCLLTDHGSLLQRQDSFRMPAMASKGSCRGKFTQLMPHHIFRDIHRDEAFAIVHGNGVADQLRKNDRTAGPCADDALLDPAVHGHDPLQQFAIDKRAFSQ